MMQVVRGSLFLLLAVSACSAPQGTTATSQTQGGSSAEDISALSDDFSDKSTLGNWKRVNKTEGWNADQLEQFDIGSREGWMTMMPFTSTWYRDYRGVLAYKEVTGDFVVTTHLQVHSRNGNSAPRSQFSLAGIMIRTPRSITPQSWRSGGENYVFLSLGAADRPGSFQFEVKTTINSDSQLQTSPTSAGDAVIQVARIGSTLIMLKKEGGNWSVHRRYDRGDFPATLQAGLTCYTDWPNASKLQPYQQNGTVIRNGQPDLVAQFDYVHYTRPKLPASLSGKRLSDSGSVSDQELLSFLGEAAAK